MGFHADKTVGKDFERFVMERLREMGYELEE